MRHIIVYDKIDETFGYMSTPWTNEALYFRWDVISEYPTEKECVEEFNKPKPYFVDSSFPCLWEDLYPVDNTMPAFTISANEAEESITEFNSNDDEAYYKNWWDITITDEFLTKERAIELVKQYKGINITIEERAILINV